MKYIKLTYIAIGICCVWLTAGCKEFLEKTNGSEVIPETVEALKELMLGEAYPLSNNFVKYLELLTDDVKSGYPIDAELVYLNNGKSVFTWHKNIFEDMGSTTGGQQVARSNSFSLYYEKILGCNIVLDMIDGVSGKEEDKLNLKGQALALRSYYYFMLVNLFGQPYNAEGVDATKSLGVPLILSGTVKDTYPNRNTVAQVYTQIEKDLLEAVPLLDLYGRDNAKFRVNDLFAYTLLSRMYLYMDNWEKSIEYADKVLARNPQLLKLAEQTIPATASVTFPTQNVYSFSSPETIWMFSSYSEWSAFFKAPSYDTPVGYSVSTELRNLYNSDLSSTTDMGDLRLRFYFYRFRNFTTNVYDIYVGAKNTTTTNYTKGMRVAESYLNRAEANIRLYLKNGTQSHATAALKDLNYLREHRFDTRNTAYTPIDISDGAALLQFCMDERRRELCFEEHRWFDLRRYGMPELKHYIQLTANATPEEHILKAKDQRYVLPIPQETLDRNPNLIQNP